MKRLIRVVDENGDVGIYRLVKQSNRNKLNDTPQNKQTEQKHKNNTD